jgi:hypothetical protein
MWIRLAATVAAAALLSACSGTASRTAQAGATSPATAAAVPASGPANAPAARAGLPGAVPLDGPQRRALDAAVAKAPPAIRPRLRYAIAAGDDGKPRLVVYDGEGLGPDGHNPGKPHDYVVFRVLNTTNGEHYDPQQNSIVAPIPPPVQREAPITP